VALVTESFLPKVDGVSKSAFLTLRYLQMTGREVMVFAPDIAPAALCGAPVLPLPSFAFTSAPETRIALPSFRIGAAFDRFQPDLVHCFSPALMSASAILAARWRRLPVITNYQTDLPAYAPYYGLGWLSSAARTALRLMHNAAHLTLAPSTHTLHQLRAGGYRRLRPWRRGVNLTRFHPARRSADWRAHLLAGRDPGSLLCIYVGRLAAEKRVDLLLETAHTPGVALTLIGDGPSRPALEARFAGTGTHFTGYLYGDDLAAAYASADVFLFPGPTETFGQVVQEAMASGLPVVVTEQGGAADLVREGETGYRCGMTESAFAEAAIRLRDAPALRSSMGAAARRAAEPFPWSAVMAQLEGYYREALRLNERAKRLNRHSAVAIRPQ
jgi:glycosyltransferase involved in cell wall biosynthesis